jgi:N-acetylmuramoyl-L-alanine amidase
MPNKIGDYELRRGSTVIDFWQLTPGATIASATPAPQPPVAPGTPNTVAVAPVFGIFDIVIGRSADPVRPTAIPATVVPTTITATPTTSSAPLMPDATGLIQIAFALPVPSAEASATLRLTVQRGSTGVGTATRLELPLRIAQNTLVNDVFIFFVVHAHPPQRYLWVKLKAVDQSAPATAIAGATGRVKILRDNLTFTGINRELPHTTDAAGFVCSTGTTRPVLGLPTGWPLLIEAAQAGFVTRSHLMKLAAQTTNDNLAPHLSTPDLRMTPDGGASLAAKRVVVDAGHGVVYGHTARRSQEWYIAHKIADAVVLQLGTAPFNMPAANVIRTRTAGFGAIEPTQINNQAAPEAGDLRFEFDLPTRRVRGLLPAVTLKLLSALLLVRHDPATLAAIAVTAAGRVTILAANAATMIAIEGRLNTSLAASNRRVRPGSMRWEVAADNYVFTEEPNPPTTPATGIDRPIPIRTGAAGDWFTLDATHVDVLAERAALWSVQNELGSGPAADPATGRPAFTPGVRAAMIADGAVDYMKRQILMYLNVIAPHAWLSHGIKGWGPTTRNTFFNATAADLYLTIHENAGGGVGGMAIVALAAAGADAPPDDQIRIGKFFLKHVDGFDHGTRAGGIQRELATNPATMLHGGNTIRAKYYYAETEFMDRVSDTNPAHYQIQDMMTPAYIDRIASQMVRAIAEILIDKQANMDSITLNGSFTLW